MDPLHSPGHETQGKINESLLYIRPREFHLYLHLPSFPEQLPLIYP